jgi:thiamine pyrophosphate-dependent acetolactate synthase large subunit-like protein
VTANERVDATTWFGSDVIVDALVGLGVDYLALNPGASIRGLHDSLINAPGRAPEIIVALHEEIAVAIAHGYAKAAGKPMAVGLHDTVGLLHASMAIFNAWVDQAPLIALVGTGPLDAMQRRPWTDWIHTVSNQGELVRQFTVWNDQPGSVDAAVDSLGRAWHTSMTSPQGPAVLTLDVTIQEGPAEPPSSSDAPSWHVRPSRLGPDPTLVSEVANRLAAARFPVAITDRPLSEAAGAGLLALAEQWGIALIERGGGGSVPVGHPHDVTRAMAEALRLADFVLFVDVRDPAWALGTVDLQTRRVSGSLPKSAAMLGTADLVGSSWLVVRSGAIDALPVPGDPELTIEALRAELGAETRSFPADMRRLVAATLPEVEDADGTAISASRLAFDLAEVLRADDVLVANGQLDGWARQFFAYAGPGSFLGRSGGSGLGYGPGASIGAALAVRDRETLVVDLQGDGDLLYTPQALWTAGHHEIPLLVVVEANRAYRKDEKHQQAIARARSRPVVRTGIHLEHPSVDLASMARSFGIGAEDAVSDRDQLPTVLSRAAARVRGGEPVLVEVITD